jgi:hypothetical protein
MPDHMEGREGNRPPETQIRSLRMLGPLGALGVPSTSHSLCHFIPRSIHSGRHCPDWWVLKKKEFQDLKKGSMTVSEYVTRFTQLSRYAPNNVDTDEKKQDYFLNGLNDGLSYGLEARDFKIF